MLVVQLMSTSGNYDHSAARRSTALNSLGYAVKDVIGLVVVNLYTLVTKLSLSCLYLSKCTCRTSTYIDGNDSALITWYLR